MGKKILMVLTSVDSYPDGSKTGWYLPEAAHPYYKFVEAGHEVTWCSMTGKAYCDPSSIEAMKEDVECVKFLADPLLKAATESQAKFTDIDYMTFDCIFVVGGFGVLWDIANDTTIKAALKEMYVAGKVVAAVCHGPACFFDLILDDGTPLVAGKQITAFTNDEENAVGKYEIVSKPSGPGSCEDNLKALGCTFVDGGVFQPQVCVAGNLFTGQNPPSAGPLAEAVIKVLA
uniref:DJ-1/PfpI domain-containing protein n=1 Tax=Aureoumbra lagunensis TaxID=44058 RepID=A0A7S3JZG6_9STRA